MLCIVVAIFLFSHISLFAFAYVFTLYCNVCTWHALNKGNLLTYLAHLYIYTLTKKRQIWTQHISIFEGLDTIQYKIQITICNAPYFTRRIICPLRQKQNYNQNIWLADIKHVHKLHTLTYKISQKIITLPLFRASRRNCRFSANEPYKIQSLTWTKYFKPIQHLRSNLQNTLFK